MRYCTEEKESAGRCSYLLKDQSEEECTGTERTLFDLRPGDSHHAHLYRALRLRDGAEKFSFTKSSLF